MDGVINVNKPSAMTSFDVVAILRKTLNMKKIGHTGTLDPDATGVLPVCLGKATKLCELLTANDKQYEAVVKLGITTDTQDMSGEVIKTDVVNIDFEDILNISKTFTGKQFQIPPMYSAIKIDGKKLYELAREGKTIKREPREIFISNIDISNYNKENNTFKMKVDCSKGTYIRTLANDIGEKLGCGAALLALNRTKSGKFTIDEAYTIEEIKNFTQNSDFSYIIPLDEIMSEYEKVIIAENNAFKLKNGIPINVTGLEYGATYRIYDEQKNFLAIARKEQDRLLVLKTFFG